MFRVFRNFSNDIVVVYLLCKLKFLPSRSHIHSTLKRSYYRKFVVRMQFEKYNLDIFFYDNEIF